MEMKESLVETNGIHLNVLEAGDPKGEPILFLHGFPEFAAAWRSQIEFFAGLGYFVLAPDQRGYNTSDKPRGIWSYRLDKLAADILGILEAKGIQKVNLVAHDWGAGVAYMFANLYGDRLKKLVILNLPHPVVMRDFLLKNHEQRKKSYYIFWFQLPFVAIWAMKANNFQRLWDQLEKTSVPGTFSEQDRGKYVEAWSKPRALSAMVNWYRAAILMPPKIPKDIRIHVPTMLLWGEKDPYLGQAMGKATMPLIDDGTWKSFPDLTHWLAHEKPDMISREIQMFLEG